MQAVHPDLTQTIGALVPASYRKHLNAENSFKNCAGALRIPYRIEEMRDLSFAEQAAHARAVLKQSNNPNAAKFIATTALQCWQDVNVYPASRKEVFILETMGRDAGWLDPDREERR